MLMVIAVFCATTFYFISQNKSKIDLKSFIKSNYPNLYIDLSKAIKKQDKEFHKIIENRGLPLIELKLSRKDIAHFSELYRKYENPRYGVKYYAKHNKWRKAKLKYGGNEYKIQIKAHGRQPDQHRQEKFISYSIKLKKGEQIDKARRFNLIIRERIRPEYHLLQDLAGKYDILTQGVELVRVKINNWEEKYYYFEHRLSRSYLESINKSSFLIFGHSISNTATSDKSLIYGSTDFSLNIFRQNFLDALISQKIPEGNKEPLLNRYLAINQDISRNSYEKFHTYFDLDYISSFEMIRTLMAFQGHGFLRSNLYTFYDTASGKFYPAFTRDTRPAHLNYKDGVSIEEQIDIYRPDYSPKSKNRLYLFHLISQNDVVRQEKYRKIYDFIKVNQGTIRSRHRGIIRKYNKMHTWGLEQILLRSLGLWQNFDYASTNMVTLKKYIEHASPEFIVFPSGRSLTIELSPNSMSALRFEKLLLPIIGDRTNNTLGVKVSITSVISKEVKKIIQVEGDVPCSNNILDVTSLISKFGFFDALGGESQLAPRKYYLSIEPISPEDFSFSKNIEVSLINNITGSVIPSTMISLKDGEVDVPFNSDIVIEKRSNIKESWKNKHKDLNVTFTDNDELILHSGKYFLYEDLVVPENFKLIIESGTTLLLDENVVLVGFDGIDVKGTETDPVVITAINPDKPFGSVGILGKGEANSNLSYLHISNGNERWFRGIYFSGALSIHYNKSVHLDNCLISKNKADDGLNIKYTDQVTINNSKFMDNFSDQVDLDYCKGVVSKCSFIISDTQKEDGNGDGLDISGSAILVKNSTFTGFEDKGISVGEDSDILVYQSTFNNNTNGVAVKDLSDAFLIKNQFKRNKNDINAYQKKSIFGGGHVYVKMLEDEHPVVKYLIDKKSKIQFLGNDFNTPVLVNYKTGEDIQDMFMQLKSTVDSNNKINN